MEELYVTVTGFSHYYGKKPFVVGNVLICEKEPGNRYDSEAIAVRLPLVGTVGFVANSTNNTAVGTMSAGRVYDKVEDKFYVRVMFITDSKVICHVENDAKDVLEAEINAQMTDGSDWL